MTVLVAMSPEVFADVMTSSIAAYASDNVAAGRWPPAGALERSRAEFQSQLPQGLATPDNHLLEIRATAHGPTVGHLWFAVQSQHGRRTAFVYDVEVQAGHRRQGHARRAFEALESLAGELGVDSIGLHVFAFNTAAKALYAALGYTVTGINMNKPLRRAAD
jgi:ribosomal protein S18 acetylase RimI-like enzyme